MKNKERGSNILFSIILRLLGRISREGMNLLGKKIKIFKDGEEYQVVHPCI